MSTSGMITTVAGNGNPGYSGDGGPAIDAEFNYPYTVAIGPSNILYIADTFNNRVRAVTNGIVHTFAGDGVGGGDGGGAYSGDGGPATNASLNSPWAVAVDASGNLFIADTSNNRIREMDTNGILTTVAGNGKVGSAGNGSTATNAELNAPGGVAVDASGNLFIADQNNNVIRKVNTNGVITTYASGFNDPIGVAVDASGNLYVGDSSDNQVKKVASNGEITVVAGNGIGGYSGDNGHATAAELWNPAGVAVDAAGNLFIADSFNNRVRKVNTNNIITTVAGNGFGAGDSGGSGGDSGDNGPATAARLFEPWGVAVDASGNLFIADTLNGRIRKVGTNGIITTATGIGKESYSGDGGAATSARVYWPFGLAVDASGNLLIADTYNQRIRKVTNP